MNELALFAGAGGGILGGKLLGWRTVCAVERDPYARDVLVARQNDGCLDPFPIWDDVCTFDGKPWRGRVDVVSGGFPCQDISAAGRGAGIDGERSGMWKHMARVVGEVRPRYVLVENSPMLVGRGLAVVLGDLAAMGYDARWGVLGAADAGAPHQRDRIWIVADTTDYGTGRREQQPQSGEGSRHVADTLRERSEAGIPEPEQREERITEKPLHNGGRRGEVRHAAGAGLPHWPAKPLGEPGTLTESERPDWWATEPELGRLAHGVANRVDQLRCLGNGQVPAVVRLAWNLLSR